MKDMKSHEPMGGTMRHSTGMDHIGGSKKSGERHPEVYQCYGQDNIIAPADHRKPNMTERH